MKEKYRVFKQGKVYTVAGYLSANVYIPISNHKTLVSARAKVTHCCKAESDKCLNV